MDATKELYIILGDDKCCPCLFWKENNEFFSDEVLYCVVKNDRPILAVKRIFLPNEFSMHGWIDVKVKPNPDIRYSKSNMIENDDHCLTLDVNNDVIHMSNFYDREWISCESMGEYLNHKPTHWQYIPTTEEMLKYYKNKDQNMSDDQIKNKIEIAYKSAAFKGIMNLKPTGDGESTPFDQNEYLAQLPKTAQGLNDAVGKVIVGIFQDQ